MGYRVLYFVRNTDWVGNRQSNMVKTRCVPDHQLRLHDAGYCRKISESPGDTVLTPLILIPANISLSTVACNTIFIARNGTR